jgi:nucleotide-binding universal stress UspA family protein
MKIIVGVDGSASAAHAVQWCAKYGGALGAEVVVVYAFEAPSYDSAAMQHYFPIRLFTEDDRARLRERVARDWCSALDAASVSHRVEVLEGRAAKVIIKTAEAEDADLVVVGRRGLGGFEERLLGSTSYHLAHHLDRPLVIVPTEPDE